MVKSIKEIMKEYENEELSETEPDTDTQSDEKLDDISEEDNNLLIPYENEIKDMLKDFTKNVDELINDFKSKGRLTDDDKNEIEQYFDEDLSIIKHNLESIYNEIGNADFSENFYGYIDNEIEKQNNKINNFIK